jgi:signal transduction histidine kinase
MMRLLLNLLQNAIRYGRVNGWVKLRLFQTPEGVAGSVEDNGIGIASENIPKIWKRFYQEDPSRNNTVDYGMGLGLPIVKWIIERHGGSISVESHVGQGTVFRFSLPSHK